MSEFNFCETLAIGDELLTGKVTDTNSTFIAGELFQLGIRLHRSTVVADDEEEMIDALNTIAGRCKVAVVFGGLGPTSDDKTAAVVAKLIGAKLVQHAPSLTRLNQFMAERKREVTATNLKQVLYPDKGRAILNPVGLAPAFCVQLKECRLYFMPGVPLEMKGIWNETVKKEVAELHHSSGAVSVKHHGWRLLGIPESEVQRLMDPVEALLPKGAWLGYRTHFPENHLVLYVSSATAQADSVFQTFRVKIAPLVAPFVYSEQEKELEVLIHEALKEQKLTLALAESCTGGLASSRLTRYPGLSDHYWGSEVVYMRQAKNDLFGLGLTHDEQTVSAETTQRLAEALFKKSQASITAAITGYLGPTGGTAESPVGTVFTYVKKGNYGQGARFQLALRDRERAQWGAATYLFHEILKSLRAGSQ